MKSDKELQSEIFQDFVKAHPELQSNINNVQHITNNADKVAYANIAIEFAIKWMKDEEALKKGILIPNTLTFELKDGIYTQITKDEKLPITSGEIKDGRMEG